MCFPHSWQRSWQVYIEVAKLNPWDIHKMFSPPMPPTQKHTHVKHPSRIPSYPFESNSEILPFLDNHCGFVSAHLSAFNSKTQTWSGASNAQHHRLKDFGAVVYLVQQGLAIPEGGAYPEVITKEIFTYEESGCTRKVCWPFLEHFWQWMYCRHLGRFWQAQKMLREIKFMKTYENTI